MSQMLKSSSAMGAATLASRILGMVREIVYARFMGDGWVASAFVLAMTIPSLFRRLLGEGALSAAFIPIFKDKEKNAGEKDMWLAANATVSGLLAAGIAIIAVAWVVISGVLLLVDVPGETRLMLELLRVMFPYMLLACLAAIFMAMLNARGFFFIPALGASMLNLVMIASVLFLAPYFGKTLTQQIFALGFGVVVAGFVQALFQLPPLLKEGFRFHWVNPRQNEVVREVVRRMLPGTIGVAAYQINVLVVQTLSFAVDSQILASFNYAVRLLELPQGVFGISLATFLLPALSGLAAEKKYGEFRSTLREGLGYLAYINLLAAAMLAALAVPIIRLLFERGAFDSGSTDRAAFALLCLAPGLVAFSTVNILARAFFALGDTKIPMQISVVCLGLNLLFTLWLIFPFKQGGIGMANTLSSIVNVGLLLYALRRKLKYLQFETLLWPLVHSFGAALLAGFTAWILYTLWDKRLEHSSFLVKLGAVFIPMAIASIMYWLTTWFLGIPQARELWNLLLRQGRKLKR
jgi:putative peptidoglycan lipid II flippase